MKSVFDFSYTYFLSLIPVRRRLPKYLAWISALLSPIEWLRDNVWNLRKKGSGERYYNPIVIYNIDSVVNYGTSTYKCLQDGTVGIEPTDIAKWILVCENYIGWEDRMKYTGGKKSLEFALYKFFSTYDDTLQFDPLHANTAPNTIYIENTNKVKGFVVFQDTGSAVYSYGSDAVYLDPVYDEQGFNILVPDSVKTKFDTEAKCTSAILAIVAKYATAGYLYGVTYY